jgi:hypothetical protein
MNLSVVGSGPATTSVKRVVLINRILLERRQQVQGACEPLPLFVFAIQYVLTYVCVGVRFFEKVRYEGGFPGRVLPHEEYLRLGLNFGVGYGLVVERPKGVLGLDRVELERKRKEEGGRGE